MMYNFCEMITWFLLKLKQFLTRSMQIIFYIFILPFSIVVALFNLFGFRMKYFLVSEKLIRKNIQYWLVVFHVVGCGISAMLFVNNLLPHNIFFGNLFRENPQSIPYTMLGVFLIFCFFSGLILEMFLCLFVKDYRKAPVY